MQPNFLIVGAAKAGTTSLYHYLSEHPQVFMSEPKEINFFSSEEIEDQGLYYDSFSLNSLTEYNKLFEMSEDKKAIGEGSVSYLFYPKTPGKIKEILPDAKIIILLRNPIERAFSHYLMDYRMGLVGCSFENIVYKRGAHKNQNLYYQQYVELGMYYKQVKRYVDLFGKSKVKIYLQEEMRQDGNKLIKDLYRFLGVNSQYTPNLNNEHNVFSMPKNKMIHKLYSSRFVRLFLSRIFSDKVKEKIKKFFFEYKKKPALSEQTRLYLTGVYKEDIGQLEKLIDKDLSKWVMDEK